MMRRLNRLAAGLIAVAWVVGPPAAVTAWALTRRPGPWPGGAGIRAWVADPPADAALIALVTAAAILLWGLTTALILRTLALRARRVWRRVRLHLPSPAQATAGSLAGTALLGLPAIAVTTVDAGPPPTAGTGGGPVDQPDHLPALDITRPAPRTHHGLDLPDGGWIPQHQAENIAAMVGLYWLRRRQTYHPGTDPHDQPAHLPTAALTTAHHTGTSTLADRSPAPTSVDQLPAGVLTLTGPGAHAAARGLLVTTLMTNTTIGTPRVHLTITAADLSALLDQRPPAPVPGLHLIDPADGSATGGHPSHRDGRPSPNRVHLTSGRHPVRRPDQEPAVTTVVYDSDRDTDADTVWYIEADGTVASTDSRRMCVLAAGTALDLLTVISQAHGLGPAGTPTPATRAPMSGRSSPATTGTRPARLTVLGEPRLTLHGEPVPVRRSAAWQALVLLAVHADGLTGRDLITTIWPGPPPASITSRLYTTLNELRTALKTRLPHTPLVAYHDQRYTLDPDVVDVDVWQMHAAIEAADTAITTTDRRRAHDEVITRYHGELAAGRNWAWLAPHREALQRHVIDAYTDLADGLPTPEAVDLLREALSIDPYNEQLHRRAVRTLTELGDHRAARRLHNTYLHRLAAAGLRPSGDIADLTQQRATPD